MLFLRAFLYYLSLAVVTPIYSVFFVLSIPLPYRVTFGLAVSWISLNLRLLRLICGVRSDIQGLENIPPGPAVILCKHQSAWETMAMVEIFPPFVWVLKRELFLIPFFGWGLASLLPIAIDRKKGVRALKQVAEQGRERLEQGLWVLLFPEGTRVKPGEKRAYLPSAGLIATETGFPIVPVAHNAGLYWPKGSFTKRPGTIRCVIGPVLDGTCLSSREIMAQAEDWIETTCAELLVGND